MYFIEMQPFNKNHRTTQRYHLRRPIKEIPPCGRNDGAGWDIGKGREKWRPSLVFQLSTLLSSLSTLNFRLSTFNFSVKTLCPDFYNAKICPLHFVVKKRVGYQCLHIVGNFRKHVKNFCNSHRFKPYQRAKLLKVGTTRSVDGQTFTFIDYVLLQNL